MLSPEVHRTTSPWEQIELSRKSGKRQRKWQKWMSNVLRSINYGAKVWDFSVISYFSSNPDSFFMCVCMYVFVLVCMYICMHVWVYICVFVYACVYMLVYMCGCIYVCLCMSVCACAYVLVCTCVCLCMYVCPLRHCSKCSTIAVYP